MELKLYNFTKKRNSTAIPTGEPAEVIQLVIKREGVSKDTPELELQNPLSRLYDYAYFDSTWYWVRNFYFDNYQRYRLVLEMDPLATYRDGIRNTPNYCERTSVTYNGNIYDTMRPADSRGYQLTEEYVLISGSGENFFANDFLISVSGASGGRVLAITGANKIEQLQKVLYTQSQAELWERLGLGNTRTYLLTGSGYKGSTKSAAAEVALTKNADGYVTDVSVTIPADDVDISPDYEAANDAALYMGDTIGLEKYLHSIIAIPFTPNAGGGSENVYLGYFDTGISATKQETPIVWSDAFNLNVPHPINTDIDGPYFWQRCAPCASYQLSVPGCGTYALDAGLLSQVDYVNVRCRLDWLGNFSGELLIQGQVICSFNGHLAISIPLSQMTCTGSITDTAASILSALSGGGILNAISNIPNYVNGFVSSGGGVTSANGNCASWGDGIMRITCSYKPPAAGFDYSRLGYPYYATITPSQNGYYKFSHATVSVGEAWENAAIETFLNGGVYIE